MIKYGLRQEEYYMDDINRLSCVTKREHMKGNMFMDNFRSGQFTVRMCRDTYNYFKKHLQEKKNSLLQNIIQEHLYIDVYEGIARGKTQVDSTSGAMVGEASRQANKTKIYYGLLKEPDLALPPEEDDDGGADGADGDKPKKKKIKKDPYLAKKSRIDPNAPPPNRVPLPELKDADKLDRLNALRESTKRVKLGPESLPSICFYTFLNNHHGVTCATISEDSSLLSAGFTDSVIRVWNLTGDKLRAIKSATELDIIDKDADDVMFRIMDENKSSEVKVLCGHTGAIYATSFNPDKSLLVSCSEDSTVRLWSLFTWTNIVCFRGHCFPVWDVKFSPFGYYFASCGHDNTARLWATDSAQPLRIFAGHVSDVDCVQFHPNCNYVATGSSDRTVRLWDLVSGSCVRFMTGHKAVIFCLAFSACGRFLASGGGDKKVLVWDLAYGHLLAELSGHTNTIYSLAFSREGTVLSSGALDCTVKVWNVQKLFDDIDPEDLNIAHTPHVRQSDGGRVNCEALLLGSYPTKSTPPICLHFTRRNLLLAAGIFQS
ncbi:TAF5 [Cordylochernes scorpioides]|uniref:TAF5 n=1 Tax=Cordylochernes scorpioides TaxID=51811 RepID=A0ABY6L791_9ARAC|nr:TAF5 [Cordylochernes scorpioides]